MDVQLIKTASASSKKSTSQIRFFHQAAKNSIGFCKNCNKDLQAAVKNLCKNKDYEGAFGETILFRNAKGQNDLYVGLGEPKDLTIEKMRRLSAVIFKKIKSEKMDQAVLPLDQVPGDLDPSHASQALTEGFLLSAYIFDDFQAKDRQDKSKVYLSHPQCGAKLKAAVADGKILAESQNFSRWLGDCPGNFMTPTELAKQTQKQAKGTGLKVTVWNKSQIAKEKMDSLIGVSNGSVQEPRFIIMEYKGAAKSKKPVCFVGKGLTFDAGGISLKPSAGMEEMKYDMCGGANVIGAVLAIAKLKLKVNLIAFVPASENMPGPAANKPGDIRKARNGKSIEINNTDAEGRLILADALSYATEKKPAWIADAATLTGAMMIALGRTHTGFYTRHSEVADLIQEAAKASGEQVWQMPLTDDHTNDMKGTYADINNIGPHRYAGSAQAAAFLENFVGDDIPWVHCDIAGTAWHASRYFPYHPSKGATGSMVRTFVEMARLHK